MAYRYATSLFLMMLSAALLTACWDKTETDQLALVSMVGVDSEPDGTITAYYQIINPLSGSSAKGTTGGNQAAVYTYEIKTKSFGEVRSNIYQVLPRRLFVAHYKALLISHRTARKGIRDYVNFVEMQPEGRSSIPILVVDGSLSDVMKTFTPLERVPAESIDSRLDMLLRHSLQTGKYIRVTDVIERMERSEMIVLPIIARTSDAPPSNSGVTSAEIDAAKDNFIITGGAVFQDYRMVGKLNDEQLIWYHLLDGDRGRHVQRFPIEGKQVSLQINLDRIQRKVTWKSGQPVVQIRMDVDLSMAYASELVPKNRSEVRKFENQLNQIIADESLALYELSRERGWDLLGIKDLLRRKTPNHPDIDTAAQNAKVTIHVNTRLMRTGAMGQPYEGTG